MEQDNNIYAYVRQQEYLYRSGTTKIAKYVNHSLSETVQRIYAYLNSKHISGEHDSLGRDKPFFNIVTAARNIWYRATEIARNKLLILPANSQEVIGAFIATALVQQWMNVVKFGVFLADWGLTLAGFGSAVTKWLEVDGNLIFQVVPWNQIICDTIDFESNPKIQVYEYTSSQLRKEALKHGWDMKTVEAILNSPTVRKLITEELQDVKSYYFKVYEVHGMFSDKMLTGKEDDKFKYSQQIHVISYVRDGNGSNSKYEDFALYQGKEKEDPYRKDDLLKEDGRTLAIGAVENLFQAQWMTNHGMKAIKDQLDLASKLVFQTSDPMFVGQNVLTAVETGQILLHKLNEPVTAFPNGSHDTSSVQAYVDQWKAVGGEINGITDAMAGVAPKGSSSWRMQSMELQQAQMLFDLMKRNKGLALEDMFRTKIIPYIKRTKLNNKDEIVAVLNQNDIKRLDAAYVPQEAVRRFNGKVIAHIKKNGRMPKKNQVNLASEMSSVQNEQTGQGNTRYFKPSDLDSKTWAEVFKDLEMNAIIDWTGESKDIQGALGTLNTALVAIMNPMYAGNAQAQAVVSKILTLTSVLSPLELSQVPPPQPPNAPPKFPPPTGAPPGGGAVAAPAGQLPALAMQ